VANPPLDQRLCTAAKPLLPTSFTLEDLTRVRREAESVSRRCGIDDQQSKDWITAVNELLINVIRHGGGRGTVRLLLLNDRFTCEVTDHGRGFNTADYVPCLERPSVSDTGGNKVWVVE
jgi:anti-sigma regulatory factor (Ser/Thr protein kinase)